MLENLTVDAYGEPTPLQHLGAVAARDSQTLAVLLYDAALKSSVAKAISESPLGFNPREEGDTLIVPIPEMTTETKREVGKMAQRAGEAAKVSVRNARKRGVDAIKKAGVPEDDAKRAQKALQKMHDEFIKKAGDLATAKEKAIVG
jgi:ribosome recycling factor